MKHAVLFNLFLCLFVLFVHLFIYVIMCEKFPFPSRSCQGGADVPLPLPLQKQKNSGQSSLEDIYNLVLPNNLEIMQLINATPTTTPNLIKCFLKAAW